MTEAVTQAAMPSAIRPHAAVRHGRRDEHAAGAFDDALGASKTPHRTETGAGGKGKVDGKVDVWRQAGVRHGAGLPAPANPKAVDGDAGKIDTIDKPKRVTATSHDEPDDAAVVDKSDATNTDADEDDGGVLTQMRAEHAISAIMTIPPTARQPVPPALHAAPRQGNPDQSDAEPDAMPSDRSQAANAIGAKLVLQQQSKFHEGPSDEHTTARRGSEPQPATGDAQVQSIAAPKAPTSAKAGAVDHTGLQAKPADAADSATDSARDKSTVATPGQARSGGSNDSADTSQGGSDGRRDARRGEQAPASSRVAVIAEQAAPAPVAPSLSANGAAIVNAVGGQQGWRATSHLSSALLGESPNNAQPMRELKIQLHPLELGVVTAHLRTVGEKLSVDLKVDNHDAYHRLSGDSDAIIKSLRSLGFDIDTVTIQQPQAAPTAVARSEANAGTGSFSHDTPSFLPGNSGSGGERFGGQASGRGEHGGGQGNDAAQAKSPDRAGSSLYI